MATPSPPAPTDRSPASLAPAFRRGARAAAARPLLALLPLLATLTAVEKVGRTATADVSFQVTFGLPTYVAGLWTFVNAPSPDGVTVFGLPPEVALDRPATVAPRLALLLGGTLLVGLLAAPYLGALDRALAGRPPAYLADCRRHARVTLGFAALEVAGLLAVGAAAVLFPAVPLLVVLALGGLVALYLLGPVPFVGVAADLPFREALRRGVALATTGPYLAFALAHALLAAVAAPLVSGLAFAAGLPSVLLAAVVAAPLGLALNAATMAFVRAAIGADAGDLASGREDGPGPDGQRDPDAPTPAIRRVDDP